MNLIRGLPVDEALEVLQFTRLRAASIVAKVVRGALANADNQGEAHLDDLIVAEARVNMGPRIKRIRPRARGMAFQIQKRMSHVHVTLDVDDDE